MGGNINVQVNLNSGEVMSNKTVEDYLKAISTLSQTAK
jgi:hypothetical protein